jgi:hypothetical protein
MAANLFHNARLGKRAPLVGVPTFRIPFHFDDLPVFHGNFAGAMDRTYVTENIVPLPFCFHNDFLHPLLIILFLPPQ